MPLIDGKFEIIRERPLGPEQTLIDATAPDGARVSIVWYEVEPDREASFEHYRKTLKRLKRLDLASLYDVVSRPGAHYVAWLPGNGARPATPDAELERQLRAAGYRPEDADIRRSDGRPRLYGLAFDGAALPVRESADAGAAPLPPKGVEPPAWAVTTLATVALTLLAVIFMAAGLAARSNDRLVTVPDVLGRGVNEAGASLASIGLDVDAVPVASQQAAGVVVALEPTAGTELRPGRTVRLSYALPPGTVAPAQVPRVVARRYPDEVENQLTAAGLRLGDIAHVPADQAAGLVISQSPEPGATVGAGSAVDILVSSGPAQQLTFLPDLVGLGIEEARYLARLAGLSPERIVEDVAPVSGTEQGTVVGQSLRPFQPFARDEATLRLIVAGRPGLDATPAAGLPSFVGMSLEEARRNAGNLRVQVSELSTRQLPEGIVDQRPSAGSEGANEVTLVVNLHPVPVPRPEAFARVREPEPRELPFRWFIEPGIPDQTARVYAETLEGETYLVLQEQVRGGDMVQGEWLTSYPGPVTFRLTLNGEPYGGAQLVR